MLSEPGIGIHSSDRLNHDREQERNESSLRILILLKGPNFSSSYRTLHVNYEVFT